MNAGGQVKKLLVAGTSGGWLSLDGHQFSERWCVEVGGHVSCIM